MEGYIDAKFSFLQLALESRELSADKQYPSFTINHPYSTIS